jgi:uncharacterized protein (DUF2384 family)
MPTPAFADLLVAVNDATVTLRRSKEVPPGVAELIEGLDRYIPETPMGWDVDPYLATSLTMGAYRSVKALRHDDVQAQRRDLRVALEQVRHALRDIVDNSWTSEDRPVGEVLESLVQMLRIPQSELAHLLGVSHRQLQRYLAQDGATPGPAEEARIRMVAQLANQLRHVFTAPGVPAWFEHPLPGAGAKPIDLLADPSNFPALMAAARGARGAP